MSERSIIEADVVVLGAGAAGLRAAVEAARAGASAAIVGKSNIGHAGASVMAGGMAVPDPAEADAGIHDFFEDMRSGGCDLGDADLLWLLASRAQHELTFLQEHGVRLDQAANGSIARAGRAGHRRPRFVSYRADSGGAEICKVLAKTAAQLGVRFIPDVFVSDICARDGRVCGARGIDLRASALLDLVARSIVLATGGGARIFPITAGPAEATGDGYRLALNVGVKLVDTEMVTFHPGGLYVDGLYAGVSIMEPSVYAALGGRIVNAAGEMFLDRQDPRGANATRDVISRLMAIEILEGRGGPNGGVYLDLSSISTSERKSLAARVPQINLTCRLAGIDFVHDAKIEIGPQAHYLIGGVRIDRNAKTNVEGLYACGEVVGGVHGANRIAGVGLLEAMVFGAIAGASAAQDARHPKGDAHLPPGTDLYSRPRDARSAVELTNELRGMMGRDASVVRTRASLDRGLSTIGDLRSHMAQEDHSSTALTEGRDFITALQLGGLVDTAETVLRGALLREESRGAHFRRDFPERSDANWLAHTSLQRVDGHWSSGQESVAQ